jgi:hypothetical protein
MATPSDEMYGTISRLFDRFNSELFEGQLPPTHSILNV